MKRFLIGQYGGFDYGKYKRDYRDRFYGIEASMFASGADCEALRREAETRGFAVGVHYRLRSRPGKLRDALFMARERAVRDAAFRDIDEELAGLAGLKPSYMLFHYPKPVLLGGRTDWSKWRFADDSEHEPDSGWTTAGFRERSEQVFDWLSRRGEAFRFTPILEFDAVNRFIGGTTMVEELLRAYPRIRLCLDTSRLHIQRCLDPDFDPVRFVGKFAGYAALVHLSNARPVAGGFERHIPVLPEQREADGWAPIASFAQLIARESPQVNVLFEHRSDLLPEGQLDRCYEYAESLFDGGSRAE